MVGENATAEEAGCETKGGVETIQKTVQGFGQCGGSGMERVHEQNPAVQKNAGGPEVLSGVAVRRVALACSPQPQHDKARQSQKAAPTDPGRAEIRTNTAARGCIGAAQDGGERKCDGILRPAG